jgi:hypothetical protein
MVVFHKDNHHEDNMARNYREEIEIALAGGAPDHVPFSFYDLLYPDGIDPSPLQAKGMAVCARRDVFRKVMPNVKVTEVREQDGGIRTIYTTPVGDLTSLVRRATLGMAPVEHAIKRRDDYKIAAFIVNDTEYEPIYETFIAERTKIGNSGKVIAHTCYEPLLDIQIVWVGQEQFCYELADNKDVLMELHEALAENHKKMYDVVAASPADYVLYGGNVVPRMLGPDRVRDHVCRCWNAFAEKLHDQGKKIGVHLDADNRLILDTVRDSQLDFIEAFTPPPDCDVSVAEARKAWPEKCLWVNFPSSVHIRSEEDIRQATLDIVRQAGDRKGFLMGVTEDIPREHIVRSVSVILETLQSCRLQ